MKLFKIVSYIGALSYILLGILTIGSIINSTIGYFINIIMGLVFISIGYYLYAKAKSIIVMISNIKGLNTEKQVTLHSINQCLIVETIFFVISLMFGLLLLSAAFYRIFAENLAIFG